MIKLIIFDWDDVFTLGATEWYFKCYHQTLVSLGVNLDQKEERRRILANWGKQARDELAGLLREHPSLLDKACKLYENILFGNTFVDSLRVVTGAPELVQQLLPSYKLAIATGVNPHLLRERIMPKLGISPDSFGEIMSVYDLDDPQKAKPHPFMLEEIMRKQSIGPTETILVGDAKTDMQMAKSANVASVAVLTGHMKREEAEELGVRHIIETAARLPDVLSKLQNRLINC